MNKQKGYINLDLGPLFWFAGIGLIAIIIFVPWLLYWLFTNVSIVIL